MRSRIILYAGICLVTIVWVFTKIAAEDREVVMLRAKVQRYELGLSMTDEALKTMVKEGGPGYRITPGSDTPTMIIFDTTRNKMVELKFSVHSRDVEVNTYDASSPLLPLLIHSEKEKLSHPEWADSLMR